MMRTAYALCLLSLSWICACAAPLAVGSMVPHEVTLEHSYRGSVSVTTEGSDSSFLRRATLRGKDLEEALVTALTSHGLFEGVADESEGTWSLHVAVTKLVEPEAGLDMTAELELKWQLKRSSDGLIVWSDSLRSSHTATTFDETFLEERRGVALEGAVRKNIERGLAELAKRGEAPPPVRPSAEEGG